MSRVPRTGRFWGQSVSQIEDAVCMAVDLSLESSDEVLDSEIGQNWDSV